MLGVDGNCLPFRTRQISSSKDPAWQIFRKGHGKSFDTRPAVKLDPERLGVVKMTEFHGQIVRRGLASNRAAAGR